MEKICEKKNDAGSINETPVFVYGTLMSGCRANSMLEGTPCMGAFRLRDYALYNLGSFPGIKQCPGESVIGELYLVNDETLERLDRYENEGVLYDRCTVTVERGDSKLTANAYVYKNPVGYSGIMREPWNYCEDDLVWYGGYGSNLSEERFALYISGGVCAENGRTYSGSTDPTPPRAVRKGSYTGELYFGNSSASWGGGGVAFYDPLPERGAGVVHMKLYLITYKQLRDVMRQEGNSYNWYGRLVCLDVDESSVPVYTLTSEDRRPENVPSEAYAGLISRALEKEFNMSRKEIDDYLRIT